MRFRDAFRITEQKGDSRFTAACELWSHQFGFELRLMIDGRGLQMSSVVRPSEMLAQIENWKAAMLEKGWRDEGSEPMAPASDEPPDISEKPPLDDAPIPPLTEPGDTEGA
jgi:hypothetical protein